MRSLAQTQAHLLWWYRCQGIEEHWSFDPLNQPEPSHVLNPPETLEDLYQRIRTFEGIELKKTALNTVIFDGDPNAPVMIIGEAPGADEDRLGKPFVGLSGQLLMNMLASIGLKREDVYITNILPWRPPLNRPPTPEEIQQCLPFVEDHISLISPRVLLLVGGVSAKALMRSEKGISLLQEETLSYTLPTHTIPAIAVYHPSYLLRSPGQKRTAWRQMRRLRAILKEFENGTP